MTADSVPCHPSFRFLQRQTVPSLQIEVQSFEHIATGAKHYHLAADSDENVFFVALRTMPQDSTGVAHILEHTALCGSEKYPVRDPFFMMIRRSLNTFMNAFTSSDWTAYPFASQNKRDFYNLLDVYLDAVFFTRLDPLDFAQEGHRLEFEDGQDPSTPLQYKGVVFNEMKGAMSAVNSQLYQELYRHLYPTTTYHHNSGGTPSHIPDLSYDQLLNFYKLHYHPSNATFMTFGNLSAQELQTDFEEKALHKFDRLDKIFEVPPEKRYVAPVRVESAYGLDEDDLDKKTYHSLAWLLGDCTDVYAQLEGEFLSELLLGNSAAPLRQALETSDLGTGPSSLCGTDTSPREMSFLVGLQGSNPDDAGAFEDLVLTTLAGIAENGIDQDQIDAAVHQLEISQREVSAGGYPYGLSLIMSGISAAIHHGDPVDALNIDPHLDKLRERTQDPNYVTDRIRALLIDNPHRVRLTLRPDDQVNSRMQALEAAQLQAIEATLSDDDKDALVAKAKALAERQEQQDDPTILPKVTKADVPETVERPTGHQHTHAFPVHYYNAGTNGLSYVSRMIDLSSLDPKQTAALKPYTRWLTSVGYGDRSYLDVQKILTATTGDVSCSINESPTIQGSDHVYGGLVFSGKALTRNLESLIDSMNQFLYAPRFDERQRLKEITGLVAAGKEQAITRSGHTLAMLAANAAQHPSSLFNHQLQGLTAVQYWKGLHKAAEADDALFDEAIQQCADLGQVLANQPQQMLLIAEADSMDAQLQQLTQQCANGTGFEHCQALPWESTLLNPRSYWITNTQVNFIGTSNMTVPYTHADSPALRILASLLTHQYLHTAIREKGGAYGGGARFGALTGTFSFYSYRDPRLEDTLNDFNKAIEWVTQNDISEQHLEEAVLTVISAIDKPSTPAQEAGSEFYSEFFGITAAVRDQYRADVLKVTVDDVKRVAQQYLSSDDRAIAVIGPGSGQAIAEKLGLAIETI